MKVLVLSGPPRSGKDTIAGFLQAHMPGMAYDKMARVLKERTHALYGLVDGRGAPRPYWHYEHSKDTPQADFCGISPRRAYIEVSERHFKRLHGKSIWADIFVAEWRARRDPPELLVISDGGFQVEIDTLRQLGPVTVWQIYRQGCSFVDDLREYVTGDCTWAIHNNDTLDDLRVTVHVMACDRGLRR